MSDFSKTVMRLFSVIMVIFTGTMLCVALALNGSYIEIALWLILLTLNARSLYVLDRTIAWEREMDSHIARMKREMEERMRGYRRDQ